ncbi:MAG TPA: hypothetical protein VE962_05670 [Actinomycetota bacterium]|nr:hypothetical protein [Actinomycetota bacterium]
MRPPRGSRERYRAVRLLIALFCAAAVVVYLAAVSIRYENVSFLGSSLALIPIVLLPMVPYVWAFRTLVGTMIVGTAFVAAVVGSLVWIWLSPEDPLEGLWLIYLTWAVALVGTAVEGAILIPLELRRLRRVS